MKKAKSLNFYKQESKVSKLIEQYDTSYHELEPLREEWEEKEAMLLGKTLDSKTQKTSSKSRVYDPRLSTYVFERAARVMAQNPTGSIRVFSKNDQGKATLLNLLLKNYVIPNANSQHNLLIKCRMLDIYSNVYGSFAVLVDWVVKDDYIGPDFYLIPIRNITFQPKISSYNDCEYIFVKHLVTENWLLKRDTKNWKNIDKLLEHEQKKEVEDKSYIEQKYQGSTTKEKFYELITKYEKDKWTTFSKDAKIIVREIENPHKNGKLPVVLKHCFPLIDRVIGLGEFERLKTLQYAMNSLINLYFEGVKMSIFPPLKITPNGVILRTLTYEAAAKWFVKDQNAVTQLPLSPLGLNTFERTYSFLNAAILNALGTTDVATTATTDPALGKTPTGLRMLQLRESARDNWDRFMMEQALEQIYDRFIDLLTKRQEKPINVYFSKEELDLIKSVNPDVVEMFESGKYGKLIIKPDDTKNTNAKFFIDAGSTLKKDEAIENETLSQIMALILKFPNAIEQISQTGQVVFGNITINFGELFKRWIITSGTQDWDKIVKENEGQVSKQEEINFENPQLQELFNQLVVNKNNEGQSEGAIRQPDTTLEPGITNF